MRQAPTSTSLRHLHRLLGEQAARELPDGALLQRFVDRCDQAAFAALVERHGQLVLRVCRHVLHQEQDAEDAFQATFLVLAHRAASIRKGASLASWLHGVAQRTALRARRSAARRRAHEQQAAPARGESPLAEAGWRELQRILDEELSGLPEKYRAPLVLCCLEGKSRVEAARELGWNQGTLSARIARGRDRLERRLARRGVLLSAVFCAVALGKRVTAAGVSTQLATATAEAALLFQAGKAAANGSARSFALAQGILARMWLTRMAGRLILGLAVSILVAAVGFAARLAAELDQPAAQPNEPQQQAEPEAPPPERGPAAQVPADLHGDPLPAGAVARLGTVRLRQGGKVGQIAFAPDSRILAASSDDGSAILWDPATGKEIRRLEGVTAPNGTGIAFSPDGSILAVGNDRGIRRWENATRRELAPFSLQKLTAPHLLYSPDGKFLACVGQQQEAYDNAVVFLDAATGRELHRLNGLKDWIAPCIAISPDSRTWAYVNKKDKEIWLYETATGEEIRRLDGHANAAMAVAFSPDGKTLASVDWDHNLRFWEPASGKMLAQTSKFSATVDLTYSPNGKLLAGGGFGSAPEIWDVTTGKEALYPKVWHRPNMPATFSGDGKLLAWAQENTIHLWDVTTGKALQARQGHEGEITGVAFAPDGKELASAAGQNGAFRLWETATGKPRPTPWSIRDYVYTVAFSPDGKTIAAGTANHDGTGTVWLLDRATGQEAGKLLARGGYVTSLAFSADGQILATKHQNATVLWDVAARKERCRVEGSPLSSSDVSLSPDGKLLAEGDHLQGVVCVREVETGKELSRFEGHWGGVYAVAFSPDGKFLASGGYDKTVRLWDLATGKELRQFEGHQNWVRFVAFSPDGRSLVSGGADKTVRLWEVGTGKERRCFTGHRSHIRTGAFSADGKTLATGSADTTVLVWDLTGHFRDGRFQTVRLKAEELPGLWAALAEVDAARAFEALQTLAAAPEESVRFLAQQLRPVQEADPRRTEELLRDLDSNDFAVREKAAQQLEGLGAGAEPALRKALRGQPPPEVRRRVEQLLEAVEGSKTRLREQRALEVLEAIGTPGAREQLEGLAKGMPAAGLTQDAKASLERLARRVVAMP
jgi:RNA polymerase sigma factor (sigma-70 family)